MKFLTALILMVLSLGAKADVFKTSFDQKQVRFPSPYGVLNQLQHITGGMASDSCNRLDRISAALLGANDPTQQAPLDNQPNDLFYSFYRFCVETGVTNAFSNSELGTGLGFLILGSAVSGRLTDVFNKGCDDPNSFNSLCADKDHRAGSAWTMVWSQLDPPLRLQLLRQFTTFLVGPEIILRDLKYLGRDNVFDVPLNTMNDFVVFLDQQLTKFPNITVAFAYAKIAILLRLGPALES
jgi:hypothetical protein